VVGRAVLGLSVGAASVHAVLHDRRGIRWAGAASYDGPAELSDVIARLAGDCGAPVRTARIALERDVVQLRTIVPAPPLKNAAVGRYVALEARRLFRKNGVPLVTDAVIVTAPGQGRVLFAAAGPEPLLTAVLAGCAQAGLHVAALAPAAEVLSGALAAPPSGVDLTFPNGGTTEVISTGPDGPWRSRLVAASRDVEVQWAAPLAELGDRAPHLAAAYASAIGRPRLELLPASARLARGRDRRRRLLRVMALGLALWLVAGATYVGRLGWVLRAATNSLGRAQPALDSALALRRELDAGCATLATIAAARAGRSRRLELWGALTRSLSDSVYLVSLTVAPDGTVRLAGLAPSAARVLAQLERLPQLSHVRLEGPASREAVPGGGERERFTIVAELEQAP